MCPSVMAFSSGMTYGGCRTSADVKEQLGHADIQTTINLYGHPDQAEHRAAAERAAAWWRTPAVRPG